LSPAGDGGGFWEGLFCFAASELGWTSEPTPIAFAWEEEFVSTGNGSIGVFQMLLAGRMGPPSMAGVDCASAYPIGEQRINTKNRIEEHTTDLTWHLP